ncbi:Ankyrin repeats (3 copies) [Novymonas esmeraldas]|uniref:Ankyrin repeats (3 copies) n=1 Tax=Novymonas esmeraldas TaxID=1808958 RepID=A0AAW0EVX0_9TRYP
MANVVEAPADTGAPVYKLPERSFLDLVAADDIVSVYVLVHGENPFDVSPGISNIRLNKELKKLTDMVKSENPQLEVDAVPRADPLQIQHIRDASGNSAAHVATCFGLPAMLRVLINECGCTVDVQNGAGLTPVHLAALHGYIGCLAVLRVYDANMLAPTRYDASRRCDLSGHTPLFLAHTKQNSAAIGVLAPLYREFIDTTFGDTAAADVWTASAAGQNEAALALLLDAVECRGTASGALPVHFEFDVEATLWEALPTLLDIVLPADQPMSPTQILVFDRLVHLGYVKESTGVGAAQTVLERVLAAAHVTAWRTLVDAGYVHPHKCSLDSVRRGGDDAATLRLLVEEAAAYYSYQASKRAYVEKGETGKRRATLLSRRTTWKALARQLTERSLSPARLLRS